MGFITIYCPISGLPLEFSYNNDGTDGNKNDVKYRHLNKVNVVLPNGIITKIGYHDGYGRIETKYGKYLCNGEEFDDGDEDKDDENDEDDDRDDRDKKCKYGIAISNSVYKLLLLHPKFDDFINNKKNLYDYINTRRSYIEKSNPVMKYFGDQSPCLEKISPKDIPYYVDPFLEEKIEESLLGSTQVRGTRKINGKKNKLHLEKIINKFLDFIPEKKDIKSSDEIIDFERMNIK
jgi:hypothetical protein